MLFLVASGSKMAGLSSRLLLLDSYLLLISVVVVVMAAPSSREGELVAAGTTAPKWSLTIFLFSDFFSGTICCSARMLSDWDLSSGNEEDDEFEAADEIKEEDVDEDVEEVPRLDGGRSS